MPERTEDLALRGVLPLTIGGEAVSLRTLTLDESDEWLDLLAQHLSDIELPDSDGQAAIRGVLTAPAASAAVLVSAYDVDGALGGLEGVRGKATKQELKDALDAMVSAEDPFGEGVGRSVGEVYGAPSRLMAEVLSAILAAAPRPVASTTGRSPATASTTASSEASGPASSSSSAGPTPMKKKRSA